MIPTKTPIKLWRLCSKDIEHLWIDRKTSEWAFFIIHIKLSIRPFRGQLSSGYQSLIASATMAFFSHRLSPSNTIRKSIGISYMHVHCIHDCSYGYVEPPLGLLVNPLDIELKIQKKQSIILSDRFLAKILY